MTTLKLPTAAILIGSFQFWQTYFGPISGWMLVAALGRAVQMRVFGPLSSPLYSTLEVMVEVARIVAVLVIVGHGNPGRGAQKVAVLCRFRRHQWRKMGQTVRKTFRQRWPVLLVNLGLFSLIAFGFNKLNGRIADHPVLLVFLKNNGLIHAAATGTPLFFFLKNLTVIPFTLIFEYGLLRWLVGKLPFIPAPVQARS